MSNYDYLRTGPSSKSTPSMAEMANEREKQELYDYLTKTGHPSAAHVLGSIVNKREMRMNPMQLIMARLRLPIMEGMQLRLPGVDDAHCYCEDGKAAIVFIVKDGKPVVIEDDPHLFPSDSLITQLRLLIGSNPAR